MHEQPCDKRIICPRKYIFTKLSKIRDYKFQSCEVFH